MATAITMSSWIDRVDAVIDAWYPGEPIQDTRATGSTNGFNMRGLSWDPVSKNVVFVDTHLGSGGTPAVTCGMSSWLIVWPSEDFGVDGRRVAFDSTLLAPITIFRGPFGASDVAAAYGRDEFLGYFPGVPRNPR